MKLTEGKKGVIKNHRQQPWMYQCTAQLGTLEPKSPRRFSHLHKPQSGKRLVSLSRPTYSTNNPPAASPPAGVELLALSCLTGTLYTPALNPLSPSSMWAPGASPTRRQLAASASVVAERLGLLEFCIRVMFSVNLVFPIPRITTFPAPPPLLEPPSASQLPTAFITGLPLSVIFTFVFVQ